MTFDRAWLRKYNLAGNGGITNNNYPGLELEHANFAEACGIKPEDARIPWGDNFDYIRAVGKLAKARSMGEVPELPQTAEEIVEKMDKFPEALRVKANLFYTQAIKQQIDKVNGLLKAAEMDAITKTQMAKDANDKVKCKEADLKQIAAQNPFGWSPDSQSAKDWSEAEYGRRHGTVSEQQKITKQNFGI